MAVSQNTRKRVQTESYLSSSPQPEIKRQKKKASKRGTKNMRRHTDISDVDQFLQERRRDERVMGAPVNEIPDEALFFEDKMALSSVEDLFADGGAGGGEKAKMTRKEMRKAILKQPTHVDRILEGNSKIKPVLAKKISTKKKGNGNRSKGLATPAVVEKKEKDDLNIWVDRQGKSISEDNDYLEPVEIKSVRQARKFQDVKQRERNAEWIPKAVQLPMKGQSYNPRWKTIKI